MPLLWSSMDKIFKFLGEKTVDFIPAGPFFLMLQVNIYRSALIRTKLPCPKKFLVTCLPNPLQITTSATFSISDLIFRAMEMWQIPVFGIFPK